MNKVQLIVVKGQERREKEFALKLLDSKLPKGEFEAHHKVFERIEQYREKLLGLGISPGTGIERRSLHAFSDSKRTGSFLVKKLYEKNLTQATQEGCFKDTQKLYSATRQILEGIVTFSTIGALFWDIKANNILVGHKGKFEVAFTDFDEVLFVNPNQEIGSLLPFLAIPSSIAHETELYEITLHSGGKIVEDGLGKFNKLCVFALGALFFEMAARISLRKFLLLSSFTSILESRHASPELIKKFWTEGCETNEKHLMRLDHLFEGELRMDYLEHIRGNFFYPNLELLAQEESQREIVKYLQVAGVPESYATWILSMLHPERNHRINLIEAWDKFKSLDRSPSECSSCLTAQESVSK